MSPPAPPIRPWPRVGPLRRYGPVVLIVAAVAGAGTLATVREAGTGARAAGTASPARPAAGAAVPPTYALAAREGRTADYRWGPQCDRTTGRLKIPTIYAPPCVPVFSGRGGGSTWNGVSSTAINVVYYNPVPIGIPALDNALGTPAERLATARAYVAMLNRTGGLYGRRVNLIPYNATGGSTDSVAATADAVTVAQQLHAFASIGGPLQTLAYADELAQLHVLCIGCGLAATYADFQRNAPYLWGELPAPDSLLNTAFSYVIDKLNGRDAIWAGDPAWHHRQRSFAVVNYVQSPPVPSSLTGELSKRVAAAHVRLAIAKPLTYQLDLTTLTDQAGTIAAKLKASGATTVIFIGDPFMPIFLTRACASIGYFPEWVITGTVYTDTSVLGRYYDQREWAHAFGISSLPVPIPVQTDDAYRVYRWWYGSRAVPPDPKNATLILLPLVQLFDGIELAGPHLTPATFAEGLFRAPPAGGGPTAPLLAYGDQGAAPAPSYTSPADYTFIWYDATAKGPDEQGMDGTGLVRYVNGGERYRDAAMPSGQVPMFSPVGAVTGDPVPPARDRPPSYPPWPGSPAAGG